MKYLFITLSIVLLNLFNGMAQMPEQTLPFIEVTGTSETEVTPDEIYISITLQERMENKEKVTIEKQEIDLKQNLKDLGIDLSNLTLNSADADYSKIRKSTKEVLISKSYVVKITGTEVLTKLYEGLDKMNAFDAHISKLSHSKMIEFTKENRIKAIKAAKDKVEYLLAAAGKQSGKVLQITETDNSVINPLYHSNYRGGRSSMAQAYSNTAMSIGDNQDEISIKKIKIISSFLVKYEILNK